VSRVLEQTQRDGAGYSTNLNQIRLDGSANCGCSGCRKESTSTTAKTQTGPLLATRTSKGVLALHLLPHVSYFTPCLVPFLQYCTITNKHRQPFASTSSNPLLRFCTVTDLDRCGLYPSAVTKLLWVKASESPAPRSLRDFSTLIHVPSCIGNNHHHQQNISN
jgi:hypothetical protein